MPRNSILTHIAYPAPARPTRIIISPASIVVTKPIDPKILAREIAAIIRRGSGRRR